MKILKVDLHRDGSISPDFLNRITQEKYDEPNTKGNVKIVRFEDAELPYGLIKIDDDLEDVDLTPEEATSQDEWMALRVWDSKPVEHYEEIDDSSTESSEIGESKNGSDSDDENDGSQRQDDFQPVDTAFDILVSELFVDANGDEAKKFDSDNESDNLYLSFGPTPSVSSEAVDTQFPRRTLSMFRPAPILKNIMGAIVSNTNEIREKIEQAVSDRLKGSELKRLPKYESSDGFWGKQFSDYRSKLFKEAAVTAILSGKPEKLDQITANTVHYGSNLKAAIINGVNHGLTKAGFTEQVYKSREALDVLKKVYELSPVAASSSRVSSSNVNEIHL